MNTFRLKMIALILMVIDHIGLYFAWAPGWFRLLGRGSYPLFLFCMIWGYHYTHDRKKYLLRLYLMGVFMGFFCYALNNFVEPLGGYGNHNIFVPMFLVGVLISTIEMFQKDTRKGTKMILAIFAVQFLYYLLPSFLPFLRNLDGDIRTAFLPNLAINEYGFAFVALGVVLYFVRESREQFCAVYLLFCIYQFSLEMLSAGSCLQSGMILALPLMMKYNRQKGPGMKYFFYIFYPAHTFLLFWLSSQFA
ncbi:MAG TPA: conjugal transfer protein TraX [Candidatus Blautia intestinigallinarum]|nr:conjugal transfer protein TraX [Candidatus Blautia intestinigallinarum]